MGLSDIEEAIDQMLGRDREQQRPPKLSWGGLLDALREVGFRLTEDDLIALPLSIELSLRPTHTSRTGNRAAIGTETITLSQ